MSIGDICMCVIFGALFLCGVGAFIGTTKADRLIEKLRQRNGYYSRRK